MKKQFIEIILLALINSAFLSCKNEKPQPFESINNQKKQTQVIADSLRDSVAYIVTISKDIPIGNYFDFMDALVAGYDSIVGYPLNEHIIVRANPWIIDTLENTDYYRRLQRGEFVYDQKKLVVLDKGDTLFIPDSLWVKEIIKNQEATVIDLNIPEFKLRIIENGKILNTFPVRVGRNEKKYLASVGKEVDLKTQPGKGNIIRINRDPVFVNPVDGKRFEYTRRDDGKTTLMPLIPWIEPQVEGYRFGHMIHPTTNPKTLGKAYSNGCVGTTEADAWRIYYYAPVGTKVNFRYDLEIKDENGDTIELKDIYNWKNKRKTTPPIAGLLYFLNEENEVVLVK